jgi:hypothetical protein
MPHSSLPAGYAFALRQELLARNAAWARGRAHVESYGNPPVIVYEPDKDRHGNFFDPAYQAICARQPWLQRLDKVHTQGERSLPRPALDPHRKWRELDSSTSSDALLMNIFCAPQVCASSTVRSMLGVESDAPDPVFGWKAQVPLANGRSDRTEVDMLWGSLLVESKLTETDFQNRSANLVEAYLDFDEVFDPELLPRTAIPLARPRRSSEYVENLSQEFESDLGDPEGFAHIDPLVKPPTEPGYASYQLLRNVLAAAATGASFCVLHDARRPDLAEAWFQVMAAVRSAQVRTRLKVLTWQELSTALPEDLRLFLDLKYGIVPPGHPTTPLNEIAKSLTG